MNAWLILFIAGLFEVAWAIGLKYADGFKNPVAAVLTVISMILSMGLLAYAVKTLPIGTAYAVWTGIGAVGVAILGMFLFNEPKDFLRLLFIFLIITGIVGLKFTAA